MSSLEKRAWLALWSMCPVYCIYFAIQIGFPDLLPTMLERIVCFALAASIHAVGYVSGLLVIKRHEAGEPLLEDERDRAIDGRATRAAYFILLTGSSPSAHNRRAASEAGVDDFLTKPIDISTLWMRLRVAERILKYTTQLNRLEEMMPMCSYCKKIRDDRNYWQQIESYINERTGTEISHSVCPECYDRVVVPELARLKASAPKPGAVRKRR